MSTSSKIFDEIRYVSFPVFSYRLVRTDSAIFQNFDEILFSVNGLSKCLLRVFNFNLKYYIAGIFMKESIILAPSFVIMYS